MYVKPLNPHNEYSQAEIEEHIRELSDCAVEVIKEFNTDKVSSLVDAKYLHHIIDEEMDRFLQQDELSPELNRYKVGFLLHFSQLHPTTDIETLTWDMDEFSQAESAYYM